MTLLNCYNWHLWVLPPEKLPQHTSKRATSNLKIASRCFALQGYRFGQTVQRFDCIACHCLHSTVKQGSSHVDNQDSAISCDAGYIMELGNGRKLVQFGLKQSELVPPGFAGGAFKYLDGHYALVLDTVYPQRVIAGKTTEQITARL
jgi:hypothetical protein